MINTLNESQLHKALKTFYAVQFSAQEEVKAGRWICDLVRPDGGVIEIQNKNVSSLKEKIKGLLAEKRKVTVVHPIIRQKTIKTFSKDGKELSSRKSPKKECLHSTLREYTGLNEFLLDKNFTLLCPEITVEERRVQSDTPQQSKNGRRRFKKAWQKTDKALLTIGASIKLCGKNDWLGLLPKTILAAAKKGEAFCAATVKQAFIDEEKKEAAPHANILLWILRKAGLIERIPHEGRSYYYQLSTMSSSSRFSMS